MVSLCVCGGGGGGLIPRFQEVGCAVNVNADLFDLNLFKEKIKLIFHEVKTINCNRGAVYICDRI